MLLLRLRPDLNDEPIAARLATRHIEVQTLSSHYTGRKHEPGLLLSFAGFAEKDLRRAAVALIEGLKK
jgi:DNA-binding transcriptional MocR family regulator